MLLPDKIWTRSLQLTEQGQVQCFVAQSSRRKVFLVSSQHSCCSLDIPQPQSQPPVPEKVLNGLTQARRGSAQVEGKDSSRYLVFPQHYCSCYSFLNTVASKGDLPYVSGHWEGLLCPSFWSIMRA